MGDIHDAAGLSDREFLTALRDHLAATLDAGPPAHTIAGLTKQLMEVRRELARLETDDDEIGKAANLPDGEFDPASL